MWIGLVLICLKKCSSTLEMVKREFRISGIGAVNAYLLPSQTTFACSETPNKYCIEFPLVVTLINNLFMLWQSYFRESNTHNILFAHKIM